MMILLRMDGKMLSVSRQTSHKRQQCLILGGFAPFDGHVGPYTRECYLDGLAP
jgi:hypothetical protein